MEATKVLVIDQYPQHVDTLVHTLKMYNCHPRGTDDIIEGLSIYTSWSPHLVVIEAGHPDMPAWEFAFEARMRQTAHRPYLVALADNGGRRERALCQECGFDRFETKPIYASDLRKWVTDAEQSIIEQGKREAPGESWDW